MYVDKKSMKPEGFMPKDVLRTIQYKRDFYRDNPHYFKPEGIVCFCGAQGEGKTLSAVQFVLELFNKYPYSILCTNVKLTNYPFNAHLYKKSKDSSELELVSDEDGCVITPETIFSGQHYNVVVEYEGLDSLKYVQNGKLGVIYLIDEIHLELNSMESKNIDMNYFIELSQQRKQRKIIVGTSQKYMRMHIALRQQCHFVVNCRCYFGLVQKNQLINNQESYEENGKLHCAVIKNIWFAHTPEMYNEYDTYQKMHRYNNEWHEKPREQVVLLQRSELLV